MTELLSNYKLDAVRRISISVFQLFLEFYIALTIKVDNTERKSDIVYIGQKYLFLCKGCADFAQALERLLASAIKIL